MKKVLVLTLIAGLSCVSASATAKQLSAQFPSAELTHLEVQNGVGEVKIVQSNDATISVEVKVKPAKKWLFKEADADSATLESSLKAGRLTVSVPMDDTEQEWLVKIPKGMALDLQLGVGEIDIQAEPADISAEIGVGSFAAEVLLSNYKDVEMSAGVGEVSVKTTENVKENSHLVGGDIHFRGHGSANISVEVGVGDAVVRDSAR
ncbi:hypothetical protein [Rheinheimera sp.]|uniref:hypothetical protein n=1 Tax=Rheinheimera sp. TaxID=1869214 RepID=UPI0027BA3A39|nr:hypothetical protein [Rheinheimera sp.]